MESPTLFPTLAKRRKWICLTYLLLFTFHAGLRAEEVSLSWNDNSDNENGFNIERAVGDGGFVSIAQVGVDVQSFSDSTAEAGVQYRYRVNAFNEYGSSEYTNVAAHYINVPPVLSSLDSLNLEENKTSGPIAFTVSDFETNAADLSVDVSSDNPELIDGSGAELGGEGETRSLKLSPKLDASGEATITVSVSDGEDSTSSTFTLSVSPFRFPTIDLNLQTIGSSVRANEDFVLSSEVSDYSLVTSVSYLIDGEILDTLSEPPYSANFSISEVGPYTLSAVASILGRDETVSSEIAVEVGLAPSSADLVSGLSTLSVGDVSKSGSASYDVELDGISMSDDVGIIGGRFDSHRYYYLMASEDLVFETKISDFKSASAGTVAGLMIRTALYDKSAHASLLFDSESKLVVRSRESFGDTTESAIVREGVSNSVWLRMERTGSTLRFSARELEGADWELLSEATLDLGSNVFVGFALAGGSDSELAEARFNNAYFEGEIVPPTEGSTRPDSPGSLLISSANPL